MPKQTRIETQVLVAGAGLAGITAAIEAAKKGAAVCLLSRTSICAGSSFYPGTWGLGLVGPEKEEDIPDLEKTILEAGEGMADPELVHTLVTGIGEATEGLYKMGAVLREAQNKDEKEFIPCFDHKKRDWHGIEKKGTARVFLRELKEQGVQLLENTGLLRIQKAGNRIFGALAVKQSGQEQELIEISCHSLILATGGLGGLFLHHLNTEDVRGNGQYLALMAGAGLVNLEFMQMMPGCLTPCPKTIYNEKMFCYSNFQVEKNLLFSTWTKKKREELFKIRSTHGPFTSRLPSGEIDIELFDTFLNHPEGICVTYQEEIKKKQPEFVRTYFEWLEKEKKLTMEDPIWIGIFAHASNGGICIDKKAFTGVPGLYACGEAAGGMHGADRLGGLSTANALVFGGIAGREAAAYSRGLERETVRAGEEPLYIIPEARDYLEGIRRWNHQAGMLCRSQEESQRVLVRLSQLEERLKKERVRADGSETAAELLWTVDLEGAAVLSRALHQSILLREESRGSHYRMDCPAKSPALEHRIVSRRELGRINTGFIEPEHNDSI